ncbi:MAG: peptide-methionine (S)-S-oxide reductase MsrA [Selenomonadaceae bacterium]|nr:peptide-methionine (S)-S-oxide reductase MsrA [Selenomonadaceae bacterium]
MTEKAIVLAGGCFWGMETLLRSLPGVLDTAVGYANGDSEAHASYQIVCTGLTGFREAVRVRYDADVIPLKQLLFVFFAAVDPTQYHRQGADVGSQYQSGVYWIDPGDEAIVRAIAAVEAAPRPDFCTELTPLKNFFRAEEYHQRYLEKNPGGYCHISPATTAMLARWDYDDAAYTRPAAWILRDHRDALRRAETLRELGYTE